MKSGWLTDVCYFNQILNAYGCKRIYVFFDFFTRYQIIHADMMPIMNRKENISGIHYHRQV